MALKLNNEKVKIDFGKDCILVQNPEQVQVLPGGRCLDMTGFTAKVINAGHVIITNGSGTYKPMPLTTTEAGATVYGSLPSGYSYVGLLYHSMLTEKPAAAILLGGIVNEQVLPYAITSIKSAFKTACPNIQFFSDEPVDVPSAE